MLHSYFAPVHIMIIDVDHCHIDKYKRIIRITQQTAWAVNCNCGVVVVYIIDK